MNISHERDEAQDDEQPTQSYDHRIGKEDDPMFIKAMRTYIMHMPQAKRNVLAESLRMLLEFGFGENPYITENDVTKALMVLKPH